MPELHFSSRWTHGEAAAVTRTGDAVNCSEAKYRPFAQRLFVALGCVYWILMEVAPRLPGRARVRQRYTRLALAEDQIGFDAVGKDDVPPQ
jgi:hypothetical protein